MSLESRVTVVTAYYEINSKFPTSQYWKWINNFCSYPFNLVIFTSPNLVEKFTTLRSVNAHTQIIPLEFNELFHYKYLDKYTQHYSADYNKSHSPDLYIIWAEKIKFVMRAIELNPFKTDKFVWCDIGVFRQEKLFQRYSVERFPQYNKIVNGKINLLLLQDFQPRDYWEAHSGNIRGQRYGDVRFGGGIQGADVDTWRKYEVLWDNMLRKYFENKRFAGQDQCIIGSIYLDNPDLFHTIRPSFKSEDGDPWFYLLLHWG